MDNFIKEKSEVTQNVAECERYYRTFEVTAGTTSSYVSIPSLAKKDVEKANIEIPIWKQFYGQVC